MTRRIKLSRATQLTETEFPNGLRILHLYTGNDPVSACHLFIPQGTNLEPAGKSGVTTLMWSLLMKGTKRKTARQLSEEVDSIGATIGAAAGHDFCEISCHSIAETFTHSLEILSEVLFEPAFLDTEVQKEKNALLAGIRAKKENIFTVGYEALNKSMFGSHPYARPASGVEETVRTLTSADLFRWHKKCVVPNRALLSLASNIPFDEIRPTLERLFGPKMWRKTKSSSPKVPALKPLAKESRLVLKEPFEQAYLMVGFLAPKVSSPDYTPLKVFNACLGGGMSARLFQTLREQQGLAYDVGSMFPSRKFGSYLVVYLGLQHARIEEAKKAVDEQLRLITTKKISKTELTETRNYLKGTYILDHQTNSQRAHYLGWWWMVGRDPLYDRDYIKDLEKVTVDHVFKVARKYLRRAHVVIQIQPKAAVKEAPPVLAPA